MRRSGSLGFACTEGNVEDNGARTGSDSADRVISRRALRRFAQGSGNQVVDVLLRVVVATDHETQEGPEG
jgi:hypothetical protein